MWRLSNAVKYKSTGISGRYVAPIKRRQIQINKDLWLLCGTYQTPSNTNQHGFLAVMWHLSNAVKYKSTGISGCYVAPIKHHQIQINRDFWLLCGTYQTPSNTNQQGFLAVMWHLSNAVKYKSTGISGCYVAPIKRRRIQINKDFWLLCGTYQTPSNTNQQGFLAVMWHLSNAVKYKSTRISGCYVAPIKHRQIQINRDFWLLCGTYQTPSNTNQQGFLAVMWHLSNAVKYKSTGISGCYVAPIKRRQIQINKDFWLLCGTYQTPSNTNQQGFLAVMWHLSNAIKYKSTGISGCYVAPIKRCQIQINRNF